MRTGGASAGALQVVDTPSAERLASTFGQRASQSFPARRRENKVRIIKIPGPVPGILNFNRASVRLWRARSPMQILLRSKPALIESVSKRLFRHAKILRMTAAYGGSLAILYDFILKSV